MLVLALAACTGTKTESSTEPTAVETVAQAQPTATPVPATDTPAAAQSSTAEPVAVAETPTAVAPGCYPEPISKLINLTANDKIAPVSADDWQKGGDDSARVVVIEYGDFQ